MSYEHLDHGIDRITCDKCGVVDSAPTRIAGKVLFEMGWALNPRAKKYKHTCGKCNGKKAPNIVWKSVQQKMKKAL